MEGAQLRANVTAQGGVCLLVNEGWPSGGPLLDDGLCLGAASVPRFRIDDDHGVVEHLFFAGGDHRSHAGCSEQGADLQGACEIVRNGEHALHGNCLKLPAGIRTTGKPAEFRCSVLSFRSAFATPLRIPPISTWVSGS